MMPTDSDFIADTIRTMIFRTISTGRAPKGQRLPVGTVDIDELRSDIAAHFATMLKATTYRFDRVRFMKRCKRL